MLSLLATVFLVAVQSTPQLFVDTNVVADVNVGSTADAAQHRTVEINTSLLSRRTPLFDLNIFPSTNLTAVYKSTDSYSDGYVWRGIVQGHPDSSVDISVCQNAVMGTIRYDDIFYQIEYAGNDVHRVKLIDESRAPGCGNDVSHAIQSAAQQSVNNSNNNARANTIIDVLVVYSTEAKNSTGGTNGMTSKINLAITESNSAYSLSGANQELYVVHKEEMIGYTEPSSFSQILSDLAGTNDGKMDNVHSLRDQYNGDCVAMICKNGQYCGIAYLMTNVSPGFAGSAFSVTNYGCATGYYSFSHELGHNMGSSHDPQNASSGAYSYSFGFRTSNNQYRTVMAYSPGTRIKRFSGPSVSYNGNTMGNSSQDNVRSLNNTAATVADFRIGTPPPPPGPVLTVPSLSAGSGAILAIADCTANGQVHFLYSTAGGGPTTTSYGIADLSLPIKVITSMTANGSGDASYWINIPAGAAGAQVWLQAYDHGSAKFSNGVYKVIF